VEQGSLFNRQMEIRDKISELRELIDEIVDIDEKIDAINYVRREIHSVSPMKHHPVDFVEWVKSDEVEANDYNPNSVAPPEMRLLILSIEHDGYTMPIVTNPEKDKIVIVDGFHRRESERRSTKISKSTYGRLPVTYIRKENSSPKDRMAATIRHNRARGKHAIDPMVEIVAKLLKEGWSGGEIAKHLGMDADEVLRLTQAAGLPELFKDHPFSKAWE
jgi:hypothetical protein